MSGRKQRGVDWASMPKTVPTEDIADIPAGVDLGDPKQRRAFEYGRHLGHREIDELYRLTLADLPTGRQR